ncbi:MAG: F0F1 ATP synthase subunit alpha [Neglectibacter timonensis]
MALNGNPEEIVSILKEEIARYEEKTQVSETGSVIQIGDGIATVYGLQNVMYGELLEFENGVKALAMNLETGSVGCALLGPEEGLQEGDLVRRTGRRADVPAGEKMLGRVINALGDPIDGKGPIPTSETRPIEHEASGVVTRQPVTVPLQTGILAIDAMVPVGRGQRELIIGDRQTGKTSIAVDTILNQKGQNVICIYVAIGQKASTVAKIHNTLEKEGAMEYSILLSSSASEPAPLQYIAPYSGAAIAEYFMGQGKDVLIVYDDLSKHAVAYRTLSLLLKRSPGREAYPGDVFYLHSRLLERACRMAPEFGGGSITALPIIETQAGDVSAYIPTHVISITDGQLYLESDLFFSGVRPAVNVGLSVSRVGGAAQTKAVKKIAGSLRIDLAQFRELEVFTQFSSDLDPATKEALEHGKRLIEVLKQPLYHPLPVSRQVVILFAATRKLLSDVPLSHAREFAWGLAEYMENIQPQVMEEIQQTGELSAENEQVILDCSEAYKKQVSPTWQA